MYIGGNFKKKDDNDNWNSLCGDEKHNNGKVLVDNNINHHKFVSHVLGD